MNKKIVVFIISSVVILILILAFFLKNNYKNLKIGNNIDSLEEIEEYILNISSYQANIALTINSNKNTNKYMVTQKYCQPNVSSQEILEPGNIKGLRTIYDGTNLKIENSNIDLITLYENYTYIADNVLWLNTFVSDYKLNENKKITEENGQIVMEVKVNKNRYIAYKKLYIDKNTVKPTKMEVLDENKNCTIYIIYNEIKIDSLNKEEVMAFKTNFLFINDL